MIKSIDFSLVIERLRAGKCPACGSKDTEFDDEIEGDNGLKCIDCNAYWDITYDLSGVAEIGYEINGECISNVVTIKNDLSNIVHVPEILIRLLQMREVLPLFLGVDKEFDRLIAESMSR